MDLATALGRKRKFHEILAERAASTAPTPSWGAALAQALQGGLAGMIERGDSAASGAEFDKLFGPLSGQQPQPAPMTRTSSEQPPTLKTALAAPPRNERVYNEGEFNRMDAAVATPQELSQGVPNYVPQPFRPIMGKAAVDSDIPVELLARQTRQESGFNPNVVSPAGARGISQFMPGTAQEMGINPNDPQQAIPAQAKYLRQNIDRFGGSTPLGLAAYNWGPGNVERWQESGGDPSKLPAETQGYIRNITSGQQPAPAAGQPPQQMAQAQPQGTRVAPQIPPQIMQQARQLYQEGEKAAAAALMQPYLTPKDQVRPMTDAERAQWKIPEGVSAGINTADGKPTFSQPANTVNVNTVANPVLEGVGKQIVANREKAETAVNTIPILHDARRALDEGATTGMAADWRVKFQKLGALFGLDASKAENSEVFINTIGREVLAHAKSLGPNPSNTDREYIKQVEAGDIKLEEKSIRRLLDISERQMRNSIKQFNSQSEKLMAADPTPYKSIAPLMRYDEPPEYQLPKKAPPQGAAAPAQKSAPKGAPSVDDLLKKYGPK